MQKRSKVLNLESEERLCQIIEVVEMDFSQEEVNKEDINQQIPEMVINHQDQVQAPNLHQIPHLLDQQLRRINMVIKKQLC